MNPVFALTAVEILVIIGSILHRQDIVIKLRYTFVGFCVAETLLIVTWLVSLQSPDFKLLWVALTALINGLLALISAIEGKTHRRQQRDR